MNISILPAGRVRTPRSSSIVSFDGGVVRVSRLKVNRFVQTSLRNMFALHTCFPLVVFSARVPEKNALVDNGARMIRNNRKMVPATTNMSNLKICSVDTKRPRKL